MFEFFLGFIAFPFLFLLVSLVLQFSDWNWGFGTYSVAVGRPHCVIQRNPFSLWLRWLWFEGSFFKGSQEKKRKLGFLDDFLGGLFAPGYRWEIRWVNFKMWASYRWYWNFHPWRKKPPPPVM